MITCGRKQFVVICLHRNHHHSNLEDVITSGAEDWYNRPPTREIYRIVPYRPLYNPHIHVVPRTIVYGNSLLMARPTQCRGNFQHRSSLSPTHSPPPPSGNGNFSSEYFKLTFENWPSPSPHPPPRKWVSILGLVMRRTTSSPQTRGASLRNDFYATV